MTGTRSSQVENLKQNIGDMEEKVQYQSEERLRDIHELLETCSTRVRLFKRCFPWFFSRILSSFFPRNKNSTRFYSILRFFSSSYYTSASHFRLVFLFALRYVDFFKDISSCLFSNNKSPAKPVHEVSFQTGRSWLENILFWKESKQMNKKIKLTRISMSSRYRKWSTKLSTSSTSAWRASRTRTPEPCSSSWSTWP